MSRLAATVLPTVATYVRRAPLRGRVLLEADRVASALEGAARQQRVRRKPHLDPGQELQALARSIAPSVVRVDQPLVLISQLHRSGGTLLMRLFDGHPQVHSIPHELGPILPSRRVPIDPEGAWRLLHDPKLARYFAHGLRQAQQDLNRAPDAIAFPLAPTVHRALFEGLFETYQPTNEREVLDAYLSAYFTAWLDYRPGDAPRQWVVGFEPGALANPGRTERFHDLYPDGRLITVVREPAGWYASAKRWDTRFERLDVALALWRASVTRAIELAERLPLAVFLVDFETLVRRPRDTLAALADRLGLRFEESLLEPTTGGMPMRANSSYPVESFGVSAEVADRGDLLTTEERERIEASCGELHRRARTLAIV